MEKNCLVIVDMVNGFVNFGALADKRINNIVPEIENAIVLAKKNGYKIIAFRDCHNMGDKEFEIYPVHCLKGSEEGELIPELKKYEKDFFIIDKNTTNGFNTPEFKAIAKHINFKNVIVVGCCTDICVKDFATSYKQYLKETGGKTNIIVPANMVSTFDSSNHNADKFQQESLNEMGELGIKIVNQNCEKNLSL